MKEYGWYGANFELSLIFKSAMFQNGGQRASFK